jgi:hypothetical protein
VARHMHVGSRGGRDAGQQRVEGERRGSVPGDDQDARSARLREERHPGEAEGGSGLQTEGKTDVQGSDMSPDWRQAIIKHLSSPGNTRDRKVHQEALKYVIVDDELY